MSTSAKNRENWEVSRHSRALTAKKCTKKRDTRAKLFFANLSLLLFCRSCCCPRRRCLSSLWPSLTSPQELSAAQQTADTGGVKQNLGSDSIIHHLEE